jgi:fimbrial isopeptide formation D2 family protein/LPXTG-motif cell wall-anchored protein
MKKTRRFAAMVAAMALAATMAAPAMSFTASAATGGANSIAVSNPDGATHTYKAYQIFAATYNDGGVLTGIDWGDGVNSTNLLTAIMGANADNNSPLKGLFDGITAASSADDVAKCLGATKTEPDPNDATQTIDVKVFGNKDSAEAQAFAELVGANLATASELTGLPDGYYLVQDSAAPNNGVDNSGAKTRYIIDVVGGGTVNVTAKHAAPTVDKQVQDEAADKDANSTDADGWGETADHAINEKFDFKLTATLTKDANYAAYDKYRLLFTDTLNAGVTFDAIKSVKVNGKDVSAYDATSAKSGYLVTAPTVTAPALGGGELKISIGDIKAWLAGTDWADEDDVEVEVIYTAHLNDNAAVEKDGLDAAAVGYDNVNKVKLNYSNNPNVEGSGDSSETPGESTGGGEENKEEFGETPEDYVWVFTYEVDNTKYKDAVADANKLGGAKFQLKDSSNAVIKFIDNGDGTYTVADQTATTGVVDTMESAAATGIFNIKGLDAGTYTLTETEAPTGYDKVADITITIDAEHQENTGGATAKLDLTGSSNMANDIIDKAGSSLPSTGGMGTKLFVLGGGVTAAMAGIYLVSKKRTKEENAE